MPGVSLSLLTVDDERLGLLDAPTAAPAWPAPAVGGTIDIHRARLPAGPNREAQDANLHADGRAHAAAFGAATAAVVATLRASEANLTELDRVVGDGDLGISLARAAHAIDTRMRELDFNDPAASLALIAASIREAVGGTSGPLYAVFMLRAARTLRGLMRRPGPTRSSPAATAFRN